jgi:hypothetical protein
MVMMPFVTEKFCVKVDTKLKGAKKRMLYAFNQAEELK